MVLDSISINGTTSGENFWIHYIKKDQFQNPKEMNKIGCNSNEITRNFNEDREDLEAVFTLNNT